MSIGSPVPSMMRVGTVKSEGSEGDAKSYLSDFAFVIGPDQISVSTIVEKLVTERLKLGIVKTAKGAEPLVHTWRSTELEKEERESSEETIPSLFLCLNKFEGKLSRLQQETTVEMTSEPDENPPNVIEPYFSEPEDQMDAGYRDPKKDIHMMLNRTRSFYTPDGFKDSRFDLKRLETERERMWTQSGKDKYTVLLYEEALKPLKHIKIKGKVYEDDDSDVLISREDLVIKSLDSIMGFVKPKELPPEEWDPGNLAQEKYAPYWAFAPPGATDKTINKIRYIYKSLKNIDFHKQDPKMRRRTGRKIRRATEEVEESDESVASKTEEETSEDEPYLLKRKDSVFLKKKVPEVVEEEEEAQALEVRSGRHNLQLGHELSISNLQKLYPDSSASSVSDSCSGDAVSASQAPTPQERRTRDSAATIKTTTTTLTRKTLRSSWLKRDELDESTSEESVYGVRKQLGDEETATKPDNKPFIKVCRGFPRIKQRPKWTTLTRECLEKDGEDQSLVERYRCLCLSRGIPPLENVARSIKKKSAIFNRMGRGPGDSIQTMAEVLGPQTKQINLTGVYMTTNDVCHLAKALPRYTHLTKLRLSRTQLNGEKLHTLINSLVECEELCLLDVSYNLLRKITSSLTKTLANIITLSTLNLSHCQLGNDSLVGLTHLPGTLKSLDLSWNRFNEASGFKLLSNCLGRNRSQLRELRLGWNSMAGVDLAKILAEIGKNVKTLTFLDISYNGFSLPEEMIHFNSMIMENRKLKCLLLGGNPLGAGAAEALLKDLQWPSRPGLRLVDLGDLWIEKDLYQVCKEYKCRYDVETRVGGIKGNVNLLELDMSPPLLKRLHFLNTSRKKKKTLKDLGNAVKKLMQREESTKVRSSKFKAFIIEENFKLEEGLAEALSKALSDKNKMIDLEAVRVKYRTLYPEQVKEPKKRKVKKKKDSEELAIVELVETKVETIESKANVVFLSDDSTPAAKH